MWVRKRCRVRDTRLCEKKREREGSLGANNLGEESESDEEWEKEREFFG